MTYARINLSRRNNGQDIPRKFAENGIKCYKYHFQCEEEDLGNFSFSIFCE